MKKPKSSTIAAIRDKHIGQLCQLNGKPAKICSSEDGRFASVGELHGPLALEWSWQAVERIMNKGGCFTA